MYDQLDNHAQLLLYLAGELPEANRARLEQQLAQDASLRSQLESLRDTQRSIDQSMTTLSAATGPIPESHLAAATRQATRLMHQWQVDRAARPIKKTESRRWRLDWRMYSVAAAVAAIMIVGIGVWWGNSDNDSVAGEPESPLVEADTPDASDPVDAFATVLDRSMLPPASPENDGIDRAERDMAQLADLSRMNRTGSTDLEMQ